jgi:cytochrome c peroxidase
LPRNPALPFYQEDFPDKFGYTANPEGGGFLASFLNPNHEWTARANSFLGKEVVHFYNTRDALPKCKTGDPGEKLTCWPAPENPDTINRKQLGDLKLNDKQEDLLVAFLKTLTDGYSSSATGSNR